ncbi:MAG TPA: hypothetical protein VFM70_00920 [Salinimicrobium sp.]|nr:hypothetical protein [Salinimicrobium sp.]
MKVGPRTMFLVLYKEIATFFENEKLAMTVETTHKQKIATFFENEKLTMTHGMTV